jgi:hypothetical protein
MRAETEKALRDAAKAFNLNSQTLRVQAEEFLDSEAAKRNPEIPATFARIVAEWTLEDLLHGVLPSDDERPETTQPAEEDSKTFHFYFSPDIQRGNSGKMHLEDLLDLAWHIRTYGQPARSRLTKESEKFNPEPIDKVAATVAPKPKR